MNYQNWLENKLREYGSKFDESNLAPKFRYYFDNAPRIRIKVKFPCGKIIWGHVGVTTGWKPVFLLLRSITQVGSHLILTSECKIYDSRFRKDI